MLFTEIVESLLQNKKVTRKEWGDKRTYLIISESLLSLHKAGEKEEVARPMIISDIDLIADDWEVLDGKRTEA